MKKEIFLALTLAIALLTAGIASSNLETYISSPDFVYEPGETIEIKAFIENPTSQTRDLTIETDIEFPNREHSGKPIQEPVTLEPGTYRIITHSLTVEPTYPSGEYTFRLKIVEGEMIIKAESYSVEVKNTLLTFKQTSFQFCLTADCSAPLPASVGRLSLTTEPVILKAIGLDSPVLSGTVTAPDQQTAPLVFSGQDAEIIFSEEGPYRIEITASKEKYQDYIKVIELEIYRGDVKIENLRACSADGICKDGENPGNCPRDCVPAEGLESEFIETAKQWLFNQTILRRMISLLANIWKP